MDVIVERFQRRKIVSNPASPMLYYLRQKPKTCGTVDIDVHGAAGLGFLTEIVQHGRSRVAHDFTALEALYNYIHKFEKLRFKLRKMSYKREVGKGRDRAPESMIIPFLKHITKIQH